jgi:hypothetical protein
VPTFLIGRFRGSVAASRKPVASRPITTRCGERVPWIGRPDALTVVFCGHFSVYFAPFIYNVSYQYSIVYIATSLDLSWVDRGPLLNDLYVSRCFQTRSPSGCPLYTTPYRVAVATVGRPIILLKPV